MKNHSILFLLLLLLPSCSDSLNFERRGNAGSDDGGLSHGMIVLGEQLEDPYSVENMTKALEKLYPTKAGRIPLPSTNLYVRFLPRDDEQMKILESMGMPLLDHPVDFEILKEGDYYHDPAIDEEAITWQYAVVDKDFEFPEGISYEILDNCYIPTDTPGTKADGIDWKAVEAESFRLTGNAGMLKSGAASGSGVPKGRITVLDEIYSPEPVGVSGVRVSCNVFVKFDECYTDADGYYEMSRTFTSEPRYRLVFKNENGFAIGMNLIIVQASVSTMGKCSVDGVDLEVSRNSDRSLFTRCVVNNAGYDYYGMCKASDSGVTAPPANLRIWIFQNLSMSAAVMFQQGAAIDRTIIGKFLGEYAFLVKMLLPDVLLGLRGKDDYSSVYAEAMHEFACASHYVKVTDEYWNKLMLYVLKSFITSGFVQYGSGTEADHGYCEVAQMWAYYMQTKMYRARYPDSSALFGTNFWFRPQIFIYMDERGIDEHKIFSVLTTDIKDVGILQDKLMYMYPECKDIITQAFMRYK